MRSLGQAIAFYLRLLRQASHILFRVTDLALTLAGIVLFLVMLFNLELAESMSEYIGKKWKGISRLWSFVPLLGIVLYGLLKANYEEFVKLSDKGNRLDELLKPKLDLVFDPQKYPDCKEGDLYRIAVVNRSCTTIDQVKAYLESVTPDSAVGGGHIPHHVPLMFEHDRPPWPRSLQGDTVHPGPPITFVDIARSGVSGTIGDHHVTDGVELCFVLQDLWRVLPPPLAQYRFILQVTGKNVLLDPVAFRINDSGIQFEPTSLS